MLYGFFFILVLVCLMFSALFSMMEAALLSVQRSRLYMLIQNNAEAGLRVEKFVRHPERFLATILFGNNLVNTAAAVLASALAIAWLGENLGVIVATVVMALIVLLFAETIPKSIATKHAEGVAIFSAKLLGIMERLLWPIVKSISWIASRFTGSAPLKYMVTEEEIRSLIATGKEQGAVETKEAEMLDRVFEFGDKPVSEVMVRRPDVIGVQKGTPLSKFLQLFSQHTHSRFPVYEGSLDNIVGIIAIKDILIAMAHGHADLSTPVDNFARPVTFVPETKLLGELLTEMQESGVQMAAVVDEFGSIAGIVTLEQLVEEIVGEVRDELAKGKWALEKVNEHTFEVDGGLRIDEANEKLSLNLPEGKYETVAGFILTRLGHIPREGEGIKFNHWKFVVTKMRGLKIDRVLITRE